MTKEQFHTEIKTLREKLKELMNKLDTEIATCEDTEDDELKETFESAYTELDVADTHLDDAESNLV
jgi:hypothetical protein